jgi:hypothetical protein
MPRTYIIQFENERQGNNFPVVWHRYETSLTSKDGNNLQIIEHIVLRIYTDLRRNESFNAVLHKKGFNILSEKVALYFVEV